MKLDKKKILFFLIIILVISVTQGCSFKSKPNANIQYQVSIWTDGNTTVFLPLPLNLPNYSVSDLVSMIELSEKSPDTEVSYDVVDTIHGKALRINTTGNVVLLAKTDYSYLETHPELPVHPFIPGQNEPMFFDLSLQVNKTDKLNYERWAYLKINDNAHHYIKVDEWLVVSTDMGAEGWLGLIENSSHYGNVTLEPGWQIINFRHRIGYV